MAHHHFWLLCTYTFYTFYFASLCLLQVTQNCNMVRTTSQRDVSGKKELAGRFLGQVGCKEKNIQTIPLADYLYF